MIRRRIEWAAVAGFVLLVVTILLWYAKHYGPSYPLLTDLKLRQLTINSSDDPVNGPQARPSLAKALDRVYERIEPHTGRVAQERF